MPNFNFPNPLTIPTTAGNFNSAISGLGDYALQQQQQQEQMKQMVQYKCFESCFSTGNNYQYCQKFCS